MLVALYNRLVSLTFGCWLLGGVMLLLAIGSFSQGEGSAINDMPLFAWLAEAPLAASWWLWATLALLALLAINTVLCSIESLRLKFRSTRFLILIAPQIMHLGFLLIVLAHLFSAYGGFKQVMQVYEGSSFGFPDGSRLEVRNLFAQFGPMGMPTDFSAEIHHAGKRGETVRIIRPNHPFFHQGFGVYLKDVGNLPPKVALLEIHREPGAGVALAGGLLFTVGNVILLAVRRGR